VVSRGLDPGDLCGAWLDAGVSLIQLRAKRLTFGPMLRLAEHLVTRISGGDARLIVNDRVDVAVLCGAAGVHLGQDDLAPLAARAMLGDRALVGLSTHAPAQVEEALRQPIDYLAIGPVFPTGTKLQPDPLVGLAGVEAAARRARPRGLPVVAIGGITLATAAAVIEAGASSVAVISDLLGGDPAARAREFVRALA